MQVNKRSMSSKGNMREKKMLINRVALFLFSLVILELAFSVHQVESIKAIKKKIILKKLKKIIPIWALLKPKKKILLIPVSGQLTNSIR